MPLPEDRSGRTVPLRALAISLAALTVPVAGALLVPRSLGEYGALLWLLALVPAFLLAYHRGWRGVATALAAGMATLSMTQAVALWLDKEIPDLLLGVVVAYLGIALGIGWVSELLHMEREEASDLAFTDILTHLPNRRHARAFLENDFAAAERGRLLSVVLFDLDHFKEYNDEYGHPAGDQALKAFADILTRTTRRMNLSARFGGEEFLSVLAGSDAEGAMVFAERIRSGLRGRALGSRPLTVSAGVATYHRSMRSPDELLAAADHALYQAKRAGRNCVRLFGTTAVETAEDAEPPTGLERKDAGEYPRSDEEIGKSSPPLTLLPHKITGFGAHRKILVVEDDTQVRDLLVSYLNREGFVVTEAGDVAEGMSALREEYDVLISDIRLPGSSGNELVAAAKSRWPATQVIVITGLQDAQVAAQALNAGADRYLFKPFGMPELRAHVADALSRRERLLMERRERETLTPEEKEREAQSLEEVLKGARALVRAVEVRDPHSRGHAERVAGYALVLADVVDPGDELLPREALRLACEFHDVGKIGVSDSILNKEARLTDDEFARVRKHTHIGRRILDPLLDDETILSVVAWHHERWDGAGYPDGLAGDGIPLPARVVAVADALDAMTSPRPYRDARSWSEALEEIEQLSGHQFAPEVVEAVMKRAADLEKIHNASGTRHG